MTFVLWITTSLPRDDVSALIHCVQSKFQFTLIGEAEDGRTATAVVGGGDPGYGETSKMVSEAALLLAQDRARLPVQGGIVTPAFAFGQAIVDRLTAAGMTLKVLP